MPSFSGFLYVTFDGKLPVMMESFPSNRCPTSR
jgi:hypothetical protein